MSIFVYVSHTDPVHALVAAQELMIVNAFPFVPSLNKLVVGRSDEDWIKYYRNWMYKCDVVLATKSHRKHEIDFARENHIPIAFSVAEATAVKLPQFAELGRKFGEVLASNLPSNEDWRRQSKDDVVKEFETLAGLGSGRTIVDYGVAALKAWDRQTNG
jgi:hypothetical protein